MRLKIGRKLGVETSLVQRVLEARMPGGRAKVTSQRPADRPPTMRSNFRNLRLGLERYVRFLRILLKKSKVARQQKSRSDQFSANFGNGGRCHEIRKIARRLSID
jgi:hypothetical protein